MAFTNGHSKETAGGKILFCQAHMMLAMLFLGLALCSLATATTKYDAESGDTVRSLMSSSSELIPEAPKAPLYHKRVENITKGKTDNASYSYLELNNGLGVFFISDSKLETVFHLFYK